MTKIKAIDLIRKIREKQYGEIKNMANGDIIQYFTAKADQFRKGTTIKAVSLK